MQLENDESISKIIAGFASLWMEDFKEESENEQGIYFVKTVFREK